MKSRHPATGKYRRKRRFGLTLGYSRKSIQLSCQVWAEFHELAFRRLGGTVRLLVLDSLKEGVFTPDIYDPALNPLYRDVLTHDGVVALPSRVGDPDREGKVEAGVGHTQKKLLPDCASRRSRTRRPTSIAGDVLGRHRIHGRRSDRSPRCLPRSSRGSVCCRSRRFAITASASAPSISTPHRNRRCVL